MEHEELLLETLQITVLEVISLPIDHPFRKNLHIPFWVIKIDRHNYNYLCKKYPILIYRSIPNAIISVLKEPKIGDNMLFHIIKRQGKHINGKYMDEPPPEKRSDEFNIAVNNIIVEAKKYYDISIVLDNENLRDIDLTKKIEEISKNLMNMVTNMENIYKKSAQL